MATAWKVSVFGDFLRRTFLHDWIQRDTKYQIRENTDLKNSKYGHFSCSDDESNGAEWFRWTASSNMKYLSGFIIVVR